MAERRPYCSDISRENDEPLGATASRVDHWLLVEYRTLWTRDALAGSGLSERVKERLREHVAAHRRSRILFVRNPERRGRPGLAVYSASSRPGEEWLTRVEIADHEEILDVDLDAGLGGEPVDHPLFLVCTHGKHDRCCARLGRPVYEALRDEIGGEWVWQSSHVGGDRFAGNVVCLPEGVYYGRLDRESAALALDAHLAGRVLLDHYRGRSCYPFAVQAAERAVRRRGALDGLADVRVERARRDGGDWTATFATAPGELHELRLSEELGELVYLTCDAVSLSRPRRFRVTHHRVGPAPRS